MSSEDRIQKYTNVLMAYGGSIAALELLGLKRDEAEEARVRIVEAYESHKKGSKITDMLAAGANPDAVVPSGWPLLCLAADECDAEVMKALLQGGANPEATQPQGFTALLLAAKNGHVQCVKELLDAGANIEEKGSVSVTALIIAARNGHTQCVEELVKRGADIHAREGLEYDNALEWAVKQGHGDVVRVLLMAPSSPARQRDMQIYVKTLQREEPLSLEVDDSDSIGLVKRKIQDMEKVPWREQGLLLGDEVLENGRTLADYNIQNESTLHLVLKLRTGRGGGSRHSKKGRMKTKKKSRTKQRRRNKKRLKRSKKLKKRSKRKKYLN